MLGALPARHASTFQQPYQREEKHASQPALYEGHSRKQSPWCIGRYHRYPISLSNRNHPTHRLGLTPAPSGFPSGSQCHRQPNGGRHPRKEDYQHGDHGEQYRGNGDVWEPRSSRESRSYRLQWSEIRVAQELRHVSRVYWILLSRICSYSARRASTFSPNTMLGGGCVVILSSQRSLPCSTFHSFKQCKDGNLEGGWSRLAQRTRVRIGNQDLRENRYIRVLFVFNRLQHFALVGNKYITWLLTLVLRINFSPVAP